MDPNATWTWLLEALDAGNWKAVRRCANDLLDWLASDGFPPDTSGGRVNDSYSNRQLAYYACKLAKVIARRRIRS
jgi:hypothetical protein